MDKTKKAETESIAQKKKGDADLKYSKPKKQKFEVLLKELCDEADTLSTDAEKKVNLKSKEVDVIAHDIEATKKKCKCTLTLKGPGIFTIFHVGANLKLQIGM